MYLLQSLFQETADHDIPKKHQKKMARACKYIKCSNKLPDIPCPQISDKTSKEDLDAVKHYHENPSLSKNFLQQSDDSVSDSFKIFCKQHGLPVNWKFIKKISDDVDTIVMHMKYKYARPRPKLLLQDEGYDCSNIKDMKSHSFPSGHTAIAYFLAGLLSDAFPDYSGDLKTFAELIGQSRIENGVHYPSDVLYGKFIGEMLADLFINDDKYQNVGKVDLNSKHYKNFSNHLFDLAKKKYPNLSEKECLKKYGHDLAGFLHRSNQIERYHIPYDECYDVALHFLMGFPTEHITDNPHLISHLDGMTMAHKLMPIDNPYKIMRIHEKFHPDVIERDKPGSLRNFKNYANSGSKYANPGHVFDYMHKLNDFKNPWVRHIIYEWVHPFADGNGRSGRIMLAADTDFDFDKIMDFIDDKYVSRIVNFVESHANMNDLF